MRYLDELARDQGVSVPYEEPELPELAEVRKLMQERMGGRQ